MADVRDEVKPKERWEFDDEVTGAFEDMLERSIPQFQTMRQAVTEMAAKFLEGQGAGAVVVDLGASRGDALAAVLEEVDGQAQVHQQGLSGHAVEVAEPMLKVLRERWDQEDPYRRVQVWDFDLRDGYPGTQAATVTLCVLTLQFTPIEHRQRILRDIYQRTIPGGVLILVEKVLGATSDIDALLIDRYYNLKAVNGYTQEQIERKRMSLEGVLVPVTAAWNRDLLRQAGFDQVDEFWRFLNFAGWVAIKSRRF